MTSGNRVLERVRRALRSESRIKLLHQSIRLEFADGDLTMEGQVPDVAAKKLALERAAAVPSVAHIIDRLRVVPASRMSDGQIRDLVRDALLQEPVFSDCALRVWSKGQPETIQAPASPRGGIDIRVEDGVVTLDGDVPGLAYKRLAGVLAWWVPGSRDVVNGLGVTPAEADSPQEIEEAVRLALEKDPFVDASQIRVGVRGTMVRLTGQVPSESESHMAECDAWYVFGVDKVKNEIAVRA